MDLNTIVLLGVPVISGLAWIYQDIKADIKEVKEDVEEVKTAVSTKLSDKEVRQIVADKIEPLREDLIEIKAQLTTLIDKLVK